MARYAGSILQSMSSYQPIFLVAVVAYLLALLVIHLLVPRYKPLAPETLA